jgi:uncharacterized membrane protein YgdD (TMEM256/DUF423 family)
MNKFFILSGSILGFLGVGFGAFGAHALRKMLEQSGRFDTYETSIKYMFYHALALVLVGAIAKDFNSKFITYSGNSFLIGTVIFSGSLLILCFTGVKAMGAVAPIGGSLLLAGWAFLFYAIFKT